MSKHTPGPWVLGHNLIDWTRELSVHESEGAGGWCVANCDMRVRPWRENAANARLIAAAPAMYARLEAAEQTIRNIVNSTWLDADAAEILRNEAENIRREIAKAREES